MAYDRRSIVQKFRGLIGFMPSWDISNHAVKIDEDLAYSESGRYLNEFHPMFTPEVFTNIASQYNSFTVASWVESKSYPVGSIVSERGNIYKSLKATAGGFLPSENDDWKKTTLLSAWYQNKYDAAVLALIDRLSEAQKLAGHGKSIQANSALYASEALRGAGIAKAGRFVGYEIELKEDGTSVSLQRVGMQLTGPALVPLHIIYNGEDRVVPIHFNGTGRFEYRDLEEPQYFSPGNGHITVGYYESDLGNSSAIGLVTNVFDSALCYTCGSPDAAKRRLWDRWISVKPVAVVNEEEPSYRYDTNYGLNLTFSYNCDLSDILIREKHSVVPALRAQLKLSFMEAIAATTRNNAQADQTHILVYNQLHDYDDPENPKRVLKRAVEALDFDLSGLGSACLPNRSGPRIIDRVLV